MSPASQKIPVDIEGRRLTLSNLQKVLYPETGFAKGQVLDYYTRIAPVLLPHLRDRPLTRKRYPDGVEGGSFFEKNAPSHGPSGSGRRRCVAGVDPQPGDHRLRRLRRPAHAGLAREPGRAGAAHPDVAGEHGRCPT